MLERPRLADEAVAAAVRTDFGISGGELVFLPLGNDAATWVYLLQAGGSDYLVKVRAGTGFRAPSLLVPHYLRQQGLRHIIAPLATREGALWTTAGDFVVTAYPFIKGDAGAHVGLSAEQWRTFGALMRQVHNCQLPAELLAQVPRERFVPSGRDLVPRLEKAASRKTFANEEERAVGRFWGEKREVIDSIVRQVDALGSRLRQMRRAGVLCHADMHPWNVLVDAEGELWLIDWDEVVIALKERDLMFAIGGIGGDGVGPEQSEWFLEDYGPAEIDEAALAYYRCAWAVQDIVEYARAVFFAPELGDVSRRAALEGFVRLFSEGAIVERCRGL